MPDGEREEAGISPPFTLELMAPLWISLVSAGVLGLRFDFQLSPGTLGRGCLHVTPSAWPEPAPLVDELLASPACQGFINSLHSWSFNLLLFVVGNTFFLLLFLLDLLKSICKLVQ